MKLKDGFVLKEISSEFIVIPLNSKVVEFNSIIKLTETGALLWSKLQSDIEADELVNALLSEYDVSKEKATADVYAFVKKLEDADLLA